MISKSTTIDFFSKSKVMFASFAMVITFLLTLYNQFKTTRATEISGIVSAYSDSTTPVDAIVRISSPIQAQTETDARGRFKFKLQNLQSDTFLLIIQNKTTNTINKQTEYVNASQGRTNIILLSRADMKDTPVYITDAKKEPVHSYKRRHTLKRRFLGLFR